jgi:hypothetical protein
VDTEVGVPLQIHIKQLAKEDGIGMKIQLGPQTKGRSNSPLVANNNYINSSQKYLYIYFCLGGSYCNTFLGDVVGLPRRRTTHLELLQKGKNAILK